MRTSSSSTKVPNIPRSRAASEECREVLEPVLKAHGYPADAAAHMASGLAAAAEIVPDILRLCSQADRTGASDADVLACLMAAALLADQRMQSERLHVALSLTETLARMMRFAEEQIAAKQAPPENRDR